MLVRQAVLLCLFAFMKPVPDHLLHMELSVPASTRYSGVVLTGHMDLWINPQPQDNSFAIMYYWL